jgi:magnesium chelatase family protein
MLFKTLSAAVFGIDANLIDVEVDVSGVKLGEDHFTTVGRPMLPCVRAVSGFARR